MLDTFFHPNGIVIIGATDNPSKGGYYILRNILAGYKGSVYPINPRCKEIQGVPCYPDVASVPGTFDLAIFFIPAKFLPQAVTDCAAKGAKGIIIEAAGFSEVGDKGRQLQDECAALAHRLGVRLWGPNCMGILDGHSRHVFSFMSSDKWMTLMKPGKVSLVVQSGMLSAGFLLMILEEGGIGISKVCSIGNKCDVNETDLLEYLLQDDDTQVIGCYLESIVDGRKFMEMARSSRKPVVVLKSGRSALGARAAMSHTASLSGESAIYDGAFKQAGIVQVYDMIELMDFVRGFSDIEFCPAQGHTAVMTFSGGAGIVTTDLFSDYNITMADFSAETKAALKQIFPEWMEPAHPVDLWPAVELNGLENVYIKAAEALMKDPSVDSILVEALVLARAKSDYVKAIGELKDKYKKPVVLWVVGVGEACEKLKASAAESGIPLFAEIGRCAAFIAGMKRHFRKKAAC